jgi:SH3-like domain-containing protein
MVNRSSAPALWFIVEFHTEEKPLYFLNSRFRLLSLRLVSLRLSLRFAPVFLLLSLASCARSGPAGSGEIMYVSAPQANLRDHVATVYNRVATVKNGDRVEVLERQHRFVRVRTAQKVEGWIELRALVPRETYDQFQQLSKDNHNTPVEGHGITRVELNMHVAPGRETETLYQLVENSKVEMLKRATAVRATPEEVAAKRAAELAQAAGELVKPGPKKKHRTPPAAPRSKPTQPAASPENHAEPSAANQPGPPEEAPPKPMDDWWLVRDAQGHTGWVLARMVDLDLPLDVVQYAEGQRILSAFVLNTVQDEQKGTVSQYLVLMNENRDGNAYDFNQVRVFTWNLKKHRYETGYREHFIMGYFPATVLTETFDREGPEPVFTLREKNADGSITPREYRLIGNVVRQVLAPGEVPSHAAHSPDEPKKSAAEKKLHGKSGAHPGKKP